jgi:hypothetical protein
MDNFSLEADFFQFSIIWDQTAPTAMVRTGFKSRRPDQIPQRLTDASSPQDRTLASNWSPKLSLFTFLVKFGLGTGGIGSEPRAASARWRSSGHLTHEEFEELWLASLRAEAADTVDLLGNARKQERERSTCAAFLRCAGIDFQADLLILVQLYL